MPSQKDNILIELDEYIKQDKMSYIVYGHHKFLIKKIRKTVQKNLQK